MALQIAPHAYVRPGELRHAEWGEFDLDGALWINPAGKMKMGKAHHVPLIAAIGGAAPERAGSHRASRVCVPVNPHPPRPMSENSINASLRRLSYASDGMTAHGFRAMASTLLTECGKWHLDPLNARWRRV